MKAKSPHDLCIVDGVRTPFCKMGTTLAALSADELGRVAVNALMTKTALDPETVDEVIFGCVSQPAEAMNVARVIALRAGLPVRTPAVTVHRNCASGFEALTTASERMAAGRGDVFIVGGTESMSQAPLLFQMSSAIKFAALARARSFLARTRGLMAFRPSDFAPRIGIQLGLTDPMSGLNMGETAEVLAREFEITRHMQDAFSLESHVRAAAARERFAEEIRPVFLKGNAITDDNGIRDKQSMDALAKLKPVFDRDTGTVTAGNASQITDGSVALLVTTRARAEKLGIEPLGYLRNYAVTGCDPKRMGLGPVSAVRATGVSISEADIIEVNEAFAAQVLAVAKELKLPVDVLNPNGGAIALGHPVGSSGARLILTSLLELGHRNAKRALVSLCVGGGQGAALWLDRKE